MGEENAVAGGDAEVRAVVAGHTHGADGGGTGTEAPVSDAEYWDGRYRERHHIWSGRPNAALLREAEGLAPGRALDLGCGEGADAIWLARQGWKVVASDISAVALERAREHAAESEVADQVDFQRHDFAESFPAGAYELVSAHFLHAPHDMPRDSILRRAADAVAPAGCCWSSATPGCRRGRRPPPCTPTTCRCPPRRRCTTASACRTTSGRSWSPRSTSSRPPIRRAARRSATTTR
ncbi:class I SAM-dependent methyltransferase [Actinacidiphila yeochonensis]|uniref:class I SAM-dependent methyltransferase n=1 Tax=Actinacidiphila yeochonensis TaxID=89050 RepID=UPI002AFF3653|nr:class I SAM-dependent methyltransferase [Actinacidiphila yeochonensis]